MVRNQLSLLTVAIKKGSKLLDPLDPIYEADPSTNEVNKMSEVILGIILAVLLLRQSMTMKKNRNAKETR